MTDAVKPLFSILCASYNRADKLPRAIDSILAQSFINWELLIIDDGSHDNTEQVVHPYLSDNRISYQKLPQNAGVGAARNHGLRSATGTWIVLLDSDNAFLPDALQIMADAITSHPNIVMHKFAVKSFDGKMMGEMPPQALTIHGKDYLTGSMKGEHHTLTKKDVLQNYPFFEKFSGGEAILWSQIALSHTHLTYHPSITQLYETDGEDRLSVKSKNYTRLAKVFGADISLLWKSYLRYAPLQLIMRLIKLICYTLASHLPMRWFGR